jgi:hypothetical protein
MHIVLSIRSLLECVCVRVCVCACVRICIYDESAVVLRLFTPLPLSI